MNQNDAKAVIKFAENDLFIGVSPSGHAIVVDADKERGSAPTPVELLMIAVGSCTAVDVISILQKKRQIVTDYRVEVGGERRDEHPRSFEKLNIHHIVRGRGISSEAVRRAIELSDQKYCSVAATLRPAAEIVTSFEIVEENQIAANSE